MAATAYASVVSLLNTLDQIHSHPLVSTFFDINQKNSLSEMVNFFVDFLEQNSDADSTEVEVLVRRIGDAAHEAEDKIEVYVADRVRGRGESSNFLEQYSDADSREAEDLVSGIADAAHEAEDKVEVYVADRVRGGGESSNFLRDLQLIIEDMESIKEEVIKAKEEIGKNTKEEVTKEETGKSLRVLPDMPPSSSSPPTTDEAPTMVGFDDYIHELWDQLTGHDFNRKIISITGTGGIGKTTLVRNLYEDSRIVRHFNIRVWITVSQDASARRVFMQALSCLQGGYVDRETDDMELSVELYKALFNRRYLIILDDIWSVEIWNKIKIFFPDNQNGSRIVVTTRESKLVDYIGASGIALKFLNEVNSWKLFCAETFPQQNFPLELVELGKKIVKKCGGLPLAIKTIGKLLGISPRTQEYWEKVAEDKGLILNLGENKSSSILYLSYKYLPICLKPCFLYLGLYPEDSNIDMDNLIKFWVAEGFIKPSRSQSLERVAESFCNDLVDRNLLLLDTYSIGSWKSISMHGPVRDLCIEIVEKENFYYVQRSMDGNRHFIVDQTTAKSYPQESHAPVTPSIFNPLIVPARERATKSKKIRLLKVFCCDERSPYYALQEVNMRFLQDLSSKQHHYLLPSLLSRFWSLQTLIVETSKGVIAPAEIWKMPQLRHINILHLYLPVPTPPLSADDLCVLQNLQTLKTVQNLIFTEEVCMRIPNIKELHIFTWERLGCQSYYHLENLAYFNKLECLNYQCILYELAGNLSRNIKFPSSLKELTLDGCKLEWSYMAVIAFLPHLRSLKLEGKAFPATEWVFVDEIFVSLKRLDISSCLHVTKWIAHKSNFPVLEDLSIWHLSELEEIPSGIGEIPTLQSIYLSFSSESANMSAVRILNEQEIYGNLILRVIIQTLKPELVWENVQELGLTCENLVIKHDYIYNPSSLKELTLSDCELEWSYMARIASLPHLEYLNIERDAIPTTEWLFVDERFVSLKILHITHCRHVTKWIADSSNFPVLVELSIWDLPKLDKIPSGIGEIPTLQLISLHHCSESANISAVQILYEQESFENLGFRVVIQSFDPELLWENVQELGLICQNLEIKRDFSASLQ